MTTRAVTFGTDLAWTDRNDWERHSRASRVIGRRREEAAVHYERQRLASLGFEESVVVWESNREGLHMFRRRWDLLGATFGSHSPF